MFDAEQDIERISMLSRAVLTEITHYATCARGGILEIGAYIGGSTVALARGNAGAFPHAVIEAGGAYAHPQLPSADILDDWRANLTAFGVSGVQLCEGWSHEHRVCAKALAHTGVLGLLFIDADGNLAPVLRTLATHMRPGCLLIFDDYIVQGAQEKAALVKPFIDHHIAQGRLLEHRIIDGTWFGALAGDFSDVPGFCPERANGFRIPAPWPADTMQGAGSRLRLFEDGVALGPAHSLLDDVAALGEGRFCHWDNGSGSVPWLYMSASDNTDPRYNGRRYTAEIDGVRVHLS